MEEETAAAEALTPIPGKQETITKDSEQPEKAKERVKRPVKNKASKSRRKDKEFDITDITSIAKHLEIQTNHLAKLEKALQSLRKLAISLDTQSKMVKEINASVKQLQRQIIQVQKTIQKGKTRN